MAEEQRSPFGELVFARRRALHLTQLELANLVKQVPRPDHAATITDRSIAALERRSNDPARWTAPRMYNVKALADAFGLQPGTPDHDEFVQAANITAAIKRGDLAFAALPLKPAPGPMPEQPRPFVVEGREPHLGRLRDAIRAVADGSPGALFLSADPGMGKTWLIEEACRRAVALYPEIVAIWGDCTGRLGTPDPYRSFRQMLGLMVGDIDSAGQRQRISNDNASRLATRLPLAVQAVVDGGQGLVHRLLHVDSLGNDEIDHRTDPALLKAVDALLQIAPPADQHPPDLARQLARVVARYADAGPMILVIEDLHWAEDETISILADLLRHMHQHRLPVLLLGSFRPVDVNFPGAGGRHPLPPLLQEASRLFNDPILDLSTAVGGDAGRAFIDAVIARSNKTWPPGIADALFEKTGGFPLFVTGLLRLYDQDAATASDRERQALEGDDSWLMAMPSEIETLFFEQVDWLPPDAQRLLFAASVQGHVFSAETLMQMMELSRAAFIDHADVTLVQKSRLLLPGGVTNIAGHAVHEYQFAHVLFRDYLYGRLTDLARSHYHTATADAMLTLYGATGHAGTEAIAVHLDRGNDRARAATAWNNAGNYATLSRDFDRAIRHFKRVGELGVRLSDPATHIEALTGLGNCARGLGRPREARETLAQALELATQHELPASRAHALEVLGFLEFDAGNMHAGADHLQAVIDVWLETGAEDDAGRSMANFSNVLCGLGQYEDALEMARRGGALATRLKNSRTWVDAHNAMAISWFDLGLFEEASATLRQCIDVCVEIDDTHRELLCWYNVSLCAIEQEGWDTARDSAERVLAANPVSQSRLIAAGEFNAGMIAEGVGDIPAARARYTTSRNIRERNGQEAWLIDSLAGLLRVAIVEGDHDRVGSLRADIKRRIGQRGVIGVGHIGRLLVTLIEASMMLNDTGSARAYARQGTAFLTERADGLTDPANRESYLTGFPSHRRVFELAAALGVR